MRSCVQWSATARSIEQHLVQESWQKSLLLKYATQQSIISSTMYARIQGPWQKSLLLKYATQQSILRSTMCAGIRTGRCTLYRCRSRWQWRQQQKQKTMIHWQQMVPVLLPKAPHHNSGLTCPCPLAHSLYHRCCSTTYTFFLHTQIFGECRFKFSMVMHIVL